MSTIEHAKTREVLKWFEAISQIPRRSKEEERIVEWLVGWGKEHGFPTKTDAVGNTLIEVPGTAGYESSPTVVLQGHMDMVCEKTPDSDHDFTKDPIKLVYDGDWLTADRTTLGADNGIALAMAMVAALDTDTPHPPLELLFTVDEETGLTGANALEPGFIKGKLLVNIDSEDEGVFTVGCAGGVNCNLMVPVERAAAPSGHVACRLSAGGMKGGHSGIDIGLNRANAIRLLGRTLLAFAREGIDTRIATLKGGSAHNAIPRDAEALLFLAAGDVAKAAVITAKCVAVFLDESKATDPELAMELEPSDAAAGPPLSAAATAKVIDFLLALPHGVEKMSPDIDDLVQTSNNFSRIELKGDTIHVLTSQRSSVVSEIEALSERIESTARLAGGASSRTDGYPPWTPNLDSPLLARSVALYERLFDKKPVVEVIHAGLECGLIADRNEGMDMISIGPDLKDPHCPDERVSIKAIGKVWDFLAALFAELK